MFDFLKSRTKRMEDRKRELEAASSVYNGPGDPLFMQTLLLQASMNEANSRSHHTENAPGHTTQSSHDYSSSHHSAPAVDHSPSYSHDSYSGGSFDGGGHH